MIQEPQEPELIEIPILNSMNTIETNSLKKNSTPNKNLSIQNNKNRTTIIQIPKQKSKPRIFLLTRPVKPQPVEINLLKHNHPQKTAANIASLTQSKIIRIPFLPRSQVQPFSVKSNRVNQVLKKDPIGVPIEVSLYSNQNHNTVQASQLEIQKQKSILAQPEAVQYVITQQVNTNQLSPVSTETSNQLQTQQSVKSAIPQRTVINNHLNLSQNKTIQTPLTLTSMAGIELTGADMSLSQADMSGAMPPTATVEEINVPVFIDEYLQQAAISTTSVSTTNNTIHYISNNNNHIYNNNNNQSNGKGNEVNNCLDTFENFEFDIDLLTENNYKDEQQLLEQQQQQEYLQLSQHTQLTEVDENTNLIFNTSQQNTMNIEDIKKQQIQKQQQHLQTQLMLEDLLFNNNTNNNNNNNTNNISSNSCKSDNNNIIIDNTPTTTTSNDNTTNNMAGFSPELDDTLLYSEESLFKIGAFSQMSEDILLPDHKDFMDIDNFNLSDNINIEEAVDFNNTDNDFNLKDCFTRPQSTQIMFATGTTSFQSGAISILSQEISEAEPTIQPERMHYDNSNALSAVVLGQPPSCEILPNEDAVSSFDSQMVNSLKRNGSQTTNNMDQKRLKLSLDTKSCTGKDLQQKSDINTPNVIKTILQSDESLDIMATQNNSINSIYQDLIATSPESPSVKSEIFPDDVTIDFSPPNTPHSFNSASNQTNFTGFMNTAPNSPASSIATSTTYTSVTNKRGRGRPAKSHSDILDISQLENLCETDRKKILERMKNNEASRKSRLKHKEREIDLEKEENNLLLKKAQLEDELKFQKNKENKLQKALKALHFQRKRHQ